MSISPYADCPCGSGKNFKWCCQSYYPLVEKALGQLKSGQSVTAEQTVAQLVAKFPKVPQAWAYQANVLISMDKREAADEALQKAFDLDPNFAMGFWLRGLMRLDEDEHVGALILFRKTAELMDPNAVALQTQVHVRIAELELTANRPVAARAAIERASHFTPQSQELRQGLITYFGPDSRLPESGRRAYTFRPGPAVNSDSWKKALDTASSGKLTDALKAWEQLVAKDSKHPAGWFNLGLTRAWLGDNPRAIEDLNRSIELDSNDARIEEAGALVEVLRCGAGMEDDSDQLEHSASFEIRDGDPIGKAFHSWGQAGRFVVINSDQEQGRLDALLLEKAPDFGIGTPVARLISNVLLDGPILKFAHPSKDKLNEAVDELRAAVTVAVGDPEYQTATTLYGDLTAEIMVFPTRENADLTELEQKMRERAREFFEETWIRRSLKSLGGASPLDAVGHAQLRKRLPGLVRYLQDCFKPIATSESSETTLYDFDRLRRKLELHTGPPAEGVEIDIDTLSAAGLAELKTTELSDDRIGEAYRAALRLDASELASVFARNASARTSIADRYPFFNFLTRQAHAEGNRDGVLQLLKDGEEADVATNEARRAAEYAVVRGQLLARGGDTEGAHTVFSEAIARTPTELRLYSAAAEAMLGRKQGARALAFAEEGLKQARAMSNRDGEGQFSELVAAARKASGAA
jgi:tetratricopeptide (TPR) repeat protein